MIDEHPAAGHALDEQRGLWLSALRRYLVATGVGNLVWELGQLPLYTIWHEGSVREIAFAVLHCTGGDLLIAGAALLGALLIVANPRWPRDRFTGVAAIAILGGVAYTIFSEWLNTEIRGSWAYTSLMPQLPLTGTGITPFAQWIVVPLAGFWWARRPMQSLRNTRVAALPKIAERSQSHV